MPLLPEALQNKLIPWSLQNGENCFIVAREKMSTAQMPDGVTLVRRKVVGSRVVIKNRRLYGNVRGLKAHWPEAHLGEWEQHKLICVLNGRIDFQLGKYAVQCGESFYLVVPPGAIEPKEQHLNAEGSSCDLLSIILHPHAIQCFIQHDDDTQDHARICENYLFKNENLMMLFRILVEEVTGERNKSRRIISTLLPTFWEFLAREVEEKHYIHPGPIGRAFMTPKNHAGFEAELLHYIQTHINGALTLEDAARALYLSRTQFVRRMRQETGKTYIRFLTDYRMGEAKVLLRDSDWTINAIANFLGFNSSVYFQRLFRHETQRTPSEYRKHIRQK
jgi:AraC-like DNA-binding protein